MTNLSKLREIFYLSIRNYSQILKFFWFTWFFFFCFKKCNILSFIKLHCLFDIHSPSLTCFLLDPSLFTSSITVFFSNSISKPLIFVCYRTPFTSYAISPSSISSSSNPTLLYVSTIFGFSSSSPSSPYNMKSLSLLSLALSLYFESKDLKCSISFSSSSSISFLARTFSLKLNK